MLILILFSKKIIDIYIMIIILRIWINLLNNDLHDNLSKFIIKATEPLINLINKLSISKNTNYINIYLILISLVITTIKNSIIMFVSTGYFYINPINLIVNIASLLKLIGNLIFYLIITRSFISFIKQEYSSINYLLVKLTDPLILPIKRIIPDVGNLDFAPTILIIFLYLLNFLGNIIFFKIWNFI
ncbi:Uncharacterized protein YggT [Buchnera aphidicola (Neophyllaphis podocarpi)]|uniref:YggT family protein n=1 Tax=Buchnera aphidicola TaxID=9 RepID=UPI0031B7F33E